MALLLAVLLSLATLAALFDANVTDQDLAKRIRGGDRAAFRHFFERYYDLLFGYLSRRNVPAPVCEDLIQNAFLHLWESRTRINPDKSLRAYLFRIGYTRALNYFRDTSKFDGSAEAEDAVSPQRDTSPSAALEYSEVQQALQKAIEALPERRRAVFELCFVEKLTYKETAQALGITVKTVENQMGHAFKSIRKAMQGFLPDAVSGGSRP